MPDGSSNAFLFKPAVRENTPMVMALAGASGSGKTFTALELAMGLAGEGKVAVIDTEGRRALHYADLRDQHTGEMLFRFDHCELRPPFSPERFLAAMNSAEHAGYRVIVIDSFSDEHEGEGGLIDMAVAGRSENTAANWAKPKAQHKLIVRWLRQTRCHVLFCLRAEERVRLEKVFDERKNREVTAVVPIGWWPIAEKRFMYDMTASFLLDPSKPGIPQPIKLQEQHRRFFPDGQRVTRESGRNLAAWAAGGAVTPRYEPTLEDRAREAAESGEESLKAFWFSLPPDQRRIIAPRMGSPREPGELIAIAQEIDRRRSEYADPYAQPPAGGEPPPASPAGNPNGHTPQPERSSAVADAVRQPAEGIPSDAPQPPAGETPVANLLGGPPRLPQSAKFNLPRDPTDRDYRRFVEWVDEQLSDGKDGVLIRADNRYVLDKLKAHDWDAYCTVNERLAAARGGHV